MSLAKIFGLGGDAAASFASGISAEFSQALGAIVLFLTNLIGIILVAAVVFVLNKYGRWKQALASLVVFLVLLASILQPLNHGLYRLYVKSTALSTMTTLIVNRPDLFTGRARLLGMNVNYNGESVSVDMELTVGTEDLHKMQERMDTFYRYLSAALNREVDIKADIIPVSYQSIHVTRAKPKISIGDPLQHETQ